MLIIGIIGLITHLFLRLFSGYVGELGWITFGTWAVIAICGAIKERRV